jgi:Raf kinase inhibitor-like YbhB/YbcL family protein
LNPQAQPTKTLPNYQGGSVQKLGAFFLTITLFVYGVNAMAMILTSTAFRNGGMIPKRYTCDNRQISPSLTWTQPPEGTKSFVLIVDDPDAPVGLFTHWVLFNIPATVTKLKENVKKLPEGTIKGNNSQGKTGYLGPCPPSGEHRYFFKLYALDTTLNLKEGTTKKEIESAMQGHILERADVMGRYSRSRKK